MDDIASRSYTVTLSPALAADLEVQAARAGISPSDVLARTFEAAALAAASAGAPTRVQRTQRRSRLVNALCDFWAHLISDPKMIHPSEETRRMSTHR